MSNPILLTLLIGAAGGVGNGLAEDCLCSRDGKLPRA